MDHETNQTHQEEQQKLEQTTADIDRQLRFYQSVPRYMGHDLTEQALEHVRETQRRNLARAKLEPYFGRLDFQEIGQETPRPLYIGKIGVEHEATSEPLVIDWRAPVASLFYSFTGSDDHASYEAPDGVITGIVDLKRNILVRNQQLVRVVDSYARANENLGVNDEFLLYRLSETKDNRLRDIVSTIQHEQDQIIRAPKDLALIIQGVAGSGKTTVALHRLAYLIYQYREHIQAQKMIIFAPNQMFLTYISDVLPELGVGDIQQRTFIDWALERLGAEIQLEDDAIRMRRWFESGGEWESQSLDTIRYKGSIEFRDLLQAYLDTYESEYLPNEPFSPWDGSTLSASTLHTWFYEEYKHYPIEKRKERVVARIQRWIEMELNEIQDTKRRKEHKKLGSGRLRSFLKRWPAHTALKLYKQFIQEPISLQAIPPAVVTFTLRQLRTQTLSLDDIAPLLLIHNRLHGLQSNERFDHVVIDEAQDFSPFQLSVLQDFARNQSFTILGDLSQGIHYYHGITSWSEFSQLFEEEQRGYFQLEQSYRSTMEIIHFANAILEKTGPSVALAKPVFRSGEKVVLQGYESNEHMQSAVIEMIQVTQTLDSIHTIAVICRTQSECEYWFQLLQTSGLKASLIDSDQKDYSGGISVLPIYLSKGLEFDAVLIVGSNENNYPSSALAAKLLYVGCTRALHHLSLVYTGAPSPLLAQINSDLYQCKTP